ncbi:MAG: hypothetical protein QXN21_06615 [Candidatus Bathyarchaeia archaeon]
MKLSKRLLLIVLLILAFLVSYAIYYVFFMPSAGGSALEILNTNFLIESHGWRITRTIEVVVRNPTTENLTLLNIRVNGEVWNLWTPRGLFLTPGGKGTVRIYYPWNSGINLVAIETEKGVTEVNINPPQFSSVNVIFKNPSNNLWSGLASFDLTFGPNELSEPKIAVYDGDIPILSQVWGVVNYTEGSVKCATVSFHVEIPAKGEKMYTLKFGVQGPVEDNPLIIRRLQNYTIVENEWFKIRFNENYLGEIDLVSDPGEEINYARIYENRQSESQGWRHGFLQSAFHLYPWDYILNAHTAARPTVSFHLDANGPLLAVYARSFRLQQNWGQVYEFYAIPHDEPAILYKVVLDALNTFTQDAGANYAPWNAFGAGNTVLPLLTFRAGFADKFFVTDTGDLYIPDWPGNDLWIRHAVAACTDPYHGVGIVLLGNDPLIPLGYWHISLRRFTGDQDPNTAPELGLWIDLIAIAGVPEGKLCWDGQNPNNEPYALEREVTPRFAITFYPGVYSWSHRVEVIIGKDVTEVLQDMREKYADIQIIIPS